jgi:MOSC domain-containing protein YiiM
VSSAVPSASDLGPHDGPTLAELRLMSLRIDPARYDLDDAAGTVGGAPWRWRWTVEGLDELPGAAVVALEAIADALLATGGQGHDLTTLAASVEQQLRALSAEHGPRTRVLDLLGPSHPLLTAAEAVDMLLSAAGRSVAQAFGRPASGRLDGVRVGSGGVPKAAVDRAEVWPRGLVGDRQAVRRHHGRPFQAVCLYSSELIAALAAEGHPLGPGSVGENLTVSGLPWAELRPGARLAVGDPGADRADPVVLELTSWAPPCATIAAAFADGDSGRIDHDRHPGWARAYAAVVRSGTVATGDPVALLP